MDYDFFVRMIADYSVFVVVALGAWALLFRVPSAKRFEAYARVLMAGLTAFLIAKLLAVTWQPTDMRPYELLGITPGASYLDNPGFPSDHALFVTAIALAVWAETRQKWLTIVLVVLVAVVSIGRVLALVHTPLDVVAGVLVACIGGLWYLQREAPARRAKKPRLT